MVANLCLMSCALLAAQSPDRSDWLLLPRLARGQELVYKGTFAEESSGQGVQFSRSYRLDCRIFVLSTAPRETEVALYTVLKIRSTHPVPGEETEPSSVRLELARVDLQGRIAGDKGVSLAVPLDGPATVECGAFVEAPAGPLRTGRSWEVSDGKRPAEAWKVLGTEVVNGMSCIKLEGLQRSPDWEQPRGDHAAWRRRDLVWVSPRLGVAYKVERTIERREPARRDPSQRSVVSYELQSSMQYPGQLFEDRRREILQAQRLAETAAPLLPNPTKQNPIVFEGMLTRIAHHVDNQPATPYREAILLVKRRVEAARRGESPPAPPTEEPVERPAIATVGLQAPDFLATNLVTKESNRLQRWLGHPIVMAFYSPTSRSAEKVLRFCQSVQTANGKAVTVLAFAIAEDTEQVRKQQSELGLTIPILSGSGLRQSYGVSATPKLIVLDADGIVRAGYIGWGPETPAAVTEQLKLWLRQPGTKDVGANQP
jgi:AhpC/TSA family